MVAVDRRLWLDADGELVEDGDDNAAFLWAAEGDEVSDEEAERVGYKAARKAPNKQAAKPANKSRTKG